GAFALVASLHGAANQSEAVSLAINGVGQLIKAQRWSIFLTQNNAEPGVRLASLATRQFSEHEMSSDRSWHLLTESCASSDLVATRAALEATSTARMIRRSETGHRILAAPLVAGGR